MVHHAPGKQAPGAPKMQKGGGEEGTRSLCGFPPKLRIYCPRAREFSLFNTDADSKKNTRALVIRDLFAQAEAIECKNTQLNNSDQHKSYYTRISALRPTPSRCVYPARRSEIWKKKKQKKSQKVFDVLVTTS